MDSNNLILVTDWEKVETDDFYLTDEWMKEDIDNIKQARQLQEEGKLYEGYIVDAKNYAIYWQMDADKVFINEDMDVVLHCESTVIGNDHKKRIEYEI